MAAASCVFQDAASALHGGRFGSAIDGCPPLPPSPFPWASPTDRIQPTNKLPWKLPPTPSPQFFIPTAIYRVKNMSSSQTHQIGAGIGGKTMVQHQKMQRNRGDDDGQELLLVQVQPQPQLYHRAQLQLLVFLFFSLVSVTFLVFSLLLLFSSSFAIVAFEAAEEDATLQETGTGSSRFPLPCTNVADGTICCDRTTSSRTDVCVMKGDVRTRAASASIELISPDRNSSVVERIRPYTRKWEKSVMDTVDELRLVSGNRNDSRKCDVVHDVPAVVFSTGGYTGNVYHEFNDGLLPLYLTAKRFEKKVVFLILEYHDWWIMKYGDVLSQLSDHPPIDFSGDKRTHCFQEAIVGLRIHDELTVDPSQAPGTNVSIVDFRRLLDDSYRPRIEFMEEEEREQEKKMKQQQQHSQQQDAAEPPEPSEIKKPKLVIVSRNGSRAIDNVKELVGLCEEIGFDVLVLRPDKTTELAKIYRDLNNSDVMIGVHGAAMTHLLFMRPKTAFVQIVPLGTEWAAEAYYGEPARKLGLKYMEYRILPRESSLSGRYDAEDPVLRDPASVAAKGWMVTKEVYLDGQSVRLDLNRFFRKITKVYHYAVRRKNRVEMELDWSWQQPVQDHHR